MENKIKKSWFNVKLYIDGLKQLKIIGIMSAIIMVCAAVLIPIGYNINGANSHEYTASGQYIVKPIVLSYTFFEMNPVILITMFVVIPLTMLVLFNFINRRNACDFYHAIPDTRECLFLSYLAAVLTWGMALAVLSAVFSMFMAAILPYVELAAGFYGEMFVSLANILAGSVYVIGVLAIAMSVTGTLLTNLCVAAMIAITPRLFVTAVVAIITEEIPMIPFSFGDSLLDDRLNVITNLVTGIVIRGEYEALTLWRSVLYTLIVGGIFVIIGMFLFKKRKSETATNPAINSKLQLVLRLIPAMLICIIPVFGIFTLWMDGEGIDGESIFLLVVLYVMAIIAYFLYELITTRKLKNLVKAIPGLCWLVVYNVVLFVILVAGYNIMLNDVPKAAVVDSVTIKFGYAHYSGYGSRDYYANRLEKIQYDSPEIIEILTSELARNAEAHKADTSLYGNRFAQVQETIDVAYVEKKNSDSYIDNVYVNFDCGLFNKNRRIYLSRAASSELMGLIADNEEFLTTLYEPVKYDDISMIYSSESGTLEEAYKKLYEIYLVNIEETKALGFEEGLMRTLNVSGRNSGEFEIYIRLKDNQRLEAKITVDTPKSYEMYMEFCNELSGGKDPFEMVFADYDKYAGLGQSTEMVDVDTNINFKVYENGEYLFSTSANWRAYNYGDSIDFNRNFTDNGKKILDELSADFKACEGKEIDTEKYYVQVSANKYNAELVGDQSDSITRFYPITVDMLNKLCEYDGREPEVIRNSK